MPDFPYKLGALPPQFPGGLSDLTYYVAGSLPTPPATLTAPSPPAGIADQYGPWNILSNDTLGDCGVAGLQHAMEVDAVLVKETETWPTSAQAGEYYMKYTGGVDGGVVLSQYLQYVRTHGYFGRYLYGYAPVKVSDVPTLQTATWMYGFVYTGVQIPQSAQEQFQNGQPWTVVNGSSIEGGHCVPIVAYDDNYLYCITWGRIQAISYSWWHQFSTEAWCAIPGTIEGHNGDGRGINLAALRADLDSLNV
jgi:hypothetical protein